MGIEADKLTKRLESENIRHKDGARLTCFSKDKVYRMRVYIIDTDEYVVKLDSEEETVGTPSINIEQLVILLRMFNCENIRD